MSIRSASGHIDYNIKGPRQASPNDNPESVSPGLTTKSPTAELRSMLGVNDAGPVDEIDASDP
jgi:hypothetical protein